jgi:hypothetical protein
VEGEQVHRQHPRHVSQTKLPAHCIDFVMHTWILRVAARVVCDLPTVVANTGGRVPA